MATLATLFREILVYISGYYLIPMFVFGMIGNMANIIVFSQGTLKNNGCSVYFVGISFVHLFVLTFGCLVRIIILLSGFDLTHSSLFFCKFRIYFFVAGIALSRYYLCLISIDRWIITSLNARIRHQSNSRSAQRLIIISTIIWLLFNLHGPIGFDIELSGCVPSSNGSYLIFYFIINIILSTVPFIVLIVFTALTLRRIIKRKSMRRHGRAIHPIGLVQRNIPSMTQNVKDQDERLSNKHLQLIRLNLIQVVFFILLNFPNTIYTMYSVITGTYKKSTEQISIDNFFNLMSSNLLYTHCAVCSTT
jgi:hypothetical protein